MYFSQVAKFWLKEFQTFETCLIDVRGGGVDGLVLKGGWVVLKSWTYMLTKVVLQDLLHTTTPPQKMSF